MYEGNLNVEELIHWTNVLDMYSGYENVVEENKIRYVVEKLKGHASLWCDGVQAKMKNMGDAKVRRRDIMVSKLKSNFITIVYQLNVFKQMKNIIKN